MQNTHNIIYMCSIVRWVSQVFRTEEEDCVLILIFGPRERLVVHRLWAVVFQGPHQKHWLEIVNRYTHTYTYTWSQRVPLHS